MSKRECVTHHHACDCREANFEELGRLAQVRLDDLNFVRKERDQLQARVKHLEAALYAIKVTGLNLNEADGEDANTLVKLAESALNPQKEGGE